MYEAQKGEGKGKGNVDARTRKNKRICEKNIGYKMYYMEFPKIILKCRELQRNFILFG